MNKNYPFSDLQTKISAAGSIVVALSANPNLDQVAAALSLYLSLRDLGKKVSLVCPSPMTVEFNRLVGINKISDKTQGTDLVVSLNYSPDQIEKVSYNDDGGKPNVVIQPKIGAPPLTAELISFNYAGGGVDLLLAIGVKNPQQLNFMGKEIFASGEIVNIDAGQANSNFGQVNLIDPNTPAVSEVVLGLILGLNYPFNVDIAQNILSGLWQSTQGLTNQSLGADTFEAVAICLRNGAQRPQGSFRREEPFRPKPKPFPAKEEGKPEKIEEKPAPPPSRPPADWFEPKIFKGSNIS